MSVFTPPIEITGGWYQKRFRALLVCRFQSQNGLIWWTISLVLFFQKKKKEMTLDFRNVPVISFIRRQFQKVWWECDWESYCWRTDVDTSGQILAGVLQRTWVSDWCLPLSLLFWGMSYPFSDCFFICKVTFSPPFRPLPRLALNAVNKSPYKLKSAI